MLSMTSLLKWNMNDSIIKQAAINNLIGFATVIDKNYEPSWHHKLIASELQSAYESVCRGERARIILELPPRHGKSDLATLKFPAWVLGRTPAMPIIVTSYSADLAADFGLATKDLMSSDIYQHLFETRLREDAKARAKWMTQDGGSYTAVGVGGPITGKGFAIGIIDDPIKNREEADSLVVRDSLWKWYRSTFLTREEGNGAIIVIMTRWHDDDLVGRILSSEGSDQWKVIKLPAIAEQDELYRLQGEALWPQRYPLEVLETRKRDLGPYEFSALYQQDPVDEAAREFNKEWFQYRTLEEVLRLSTRRFITIDPASAMRDKSDFIGIVVNFVDLESKWNLMSYKIKVDSMGLIDFILKLHGDYHPESIGIEEGVYQQTIKPFFQEECRRRNIYPHIVELKHQQQNKHLRIRGLIPRYSTQSILHITGMADELEGELIRFPKAINDDVADAAAYQLQIAKGGKPIQFQASPPVADISDQLFYAGGVNPKARSSRASPALVWDREIM